MADAKATGDGLADLKNAITDTTGDTQIPLVANKYIDLSGSSVTMSGGIPQYTTGTTTYSCGYMACSVGERFIINGHGGGQTRLWAFINSSGEILTKSAANITKNNLQLVAPENSAFIIIHTNDNGNSYKTVANVLFDDLVQTIIGSNAYDVIQNLPRINGTGVNGVDYTWAGNVCTVSGSTSSNVISNNNIWLYTDGFPFGIGPGDQYFVWSKDYVSNGVWLRIIFKLADDSTEYVYYAYSKVGIVPSNAVGMTVQLYIPSNTSINTTKEFKLYKLSDGDSYLLYYPQNALVNNVLLTFGNYSDKEVFNVKFKWSADRASCVVSGTSSSAYANDPLWLYTSGLPPIIKPGTKYDVFFSSTKETPDVGVRIYFRHTGGATENISIKGNRTIVIPSDCNGITVRLEIEQSGVQVNETVRLSMRENISTSSAGNPVAKMYSIGSSFLTGAIYPTGNTGGLDHLCSFENSPYGNVAIGLGISQENVTHRLVSSTGLLYDVGYGSILSLLKETDLSGYDYVLTQYNRPDLGVSSGSGFPLGDMSSVAGDGSIVGAVLELLSYIKQQNPNSTLILVGAPPSDQRDAYSGQYVFTAKYANGVSIGEADMMLSRIAARDHFIFIGWEDLNLSYYYRDLCYGDGNVHPTHDATCRAMGMYLARQCSYAVDLIKASNHRYLTSSEVAALNTLLDVPVNKCLSANGARILELDVREY